MAKDKMTVCKHCGAEIAAGAKTCPQCGGQNNKPIYKRVWFWILIVILVIGIAGVSGGSGESDSGAAADTSSDKQTEQAAEEKAVEYADVSVETLFQDLESNAMNASDTYKGNYYAVSGILGTIDSDGSYLAVESDNDEYMFQSVTCYIKNDAQLEKIKSMSTGNSITVKGKITDVGEVLGYYLDIDAIE